MPRQVRADVRDKARTIICILKVTAGLNYSFLAQFPLKELERYLNRLVFPIFIDT